MDKSQGRFIIVERVGLANDSNDLRRLMQLAYGRLSHLKGQQSFAFNFNEDQHFLRQVKESIGHVCVIGPELILGKIFEEVGYTVVPDELFRHLVITRLISPGSKLHMVDYLLQYKGKIIHEDKIYRFMDKFNLHYQDEVIQLTTAHTKKILGGEITVAFFDVTTLYFEAPTEDELRRIGFSKDGKAQNPQVLLCLLVGKDGHPLAYEIFPGNTFEGHTLIPVIDAFKTKYSISTLTVVADAGLLSKKNIEALKEKNYPFILGARMKNESEESKQQILSGDYQDGQIKCFLRSDNTRLLVSYSSKRARKDEHTRKLGLTRLERQVRAGKLSKQQVNNRGYNKYLKIKSDVIVEIDYRAFNQDACWNGLKGYVTTSELSDEQVIENYRHLWHIEKAFRISKTDLRIRPVYHYRERRIRTHICIAFCAYKIYKELERQLAEKKLGISTEHAITLLRTIYQTTIKLPISQKEETVFLPMLYEQNQLLSAFGIESESG